MTLKKLAFYAAVALAVGFLVQSPGEAARVVKVTGTSAGEMLSTAADAFGEFIRSLV